MSAGMERHPDRCGTCGGTGSATAARCKDCQGRGVNHEPARRLFPSRQVLAIAQLEEIAREHGRGHARVERSLDAEGFALFVTLTGATTRWLSYEFEGQPRRVEIAEHVVDGLVLQVFGPSSAAPMLKLVDVIR